MVTASLAATTHPHFPIHGSLVSKDLIFFFFLSFNFNDLVLRARFPFNMGVRDGSGGGKNLPELSRYGRRFSRGKPIQKELS